MVAIIRIQRNDLIVAIPLVLATAVVAQDTTASGPQKPTTTQSASEAADTQLQKDVQNPLADLISVPFQNNTNFDSGPSNRAQDVLNIQPVIPVKISDNWIVIMRIIQPLVWQPFSNQNTGGEYGPSGMNPTIFLAPRKH